MTSEEYSKQIFEIREAIGEYIEHILKSKDRMVRIYTYALATKIHQLGNLQMKVFGELLKNENNELLKRVSGGSEYKSL